jgi:hypothetical protein
MSVKKARYIGHPDGVDLSIPFRDGDVVQLHTSRTAPNCRRRSVAGRSLRRSETACCAGRQLDGGQAGHWL